MIPAWLRTLAQALGILAPPVIAALEPEPPKLDPPLPDESQTERVRREADAARAARLKEPKP